MTQNLMGARHWTATAVRTSVVFVAIGILLAMVGALSTTWGVAFLGLFMFGVGIVLGLVGAVASGFRR